MRCKQAGHGFGGFEAVGGWPTSAVGEPAAGRVARERRRRRRRERAPEADGYADAAPERSRLSRAERVAEQKVKLAGDALRFGALATLLLIFVWPVGMIVLICGGPSLLRRFYRLTLEPRLRERFIEEEVRNQVRATLARERRTLEGQHARSMEELSASIAHEIRNPITAAKSLVQQMGEDTSAGENVEYARVALEELSRVERSVSHLLRFARDEEMQVAPVQLADVVDSALETFHDRIERSGIRLERQVDCEGAMQGDAEKLRRVVINLVGNSIDALTEAEVRDPRLEVALGENLAGSEVWLRIRDNGPGIDPDTRAKIFSPFYTTKVGGTGLGLAITRKLVEAHGGSIELDPEQQAGTEFVLTFPKHFARAAGRETSTDTGSAS